MAGKRVFLIVLDGVGIGCAPDALAYGDEGANTLGSILEKRSIALPNFEALGMGNLAGVQNLAKEAHPMAYHGVLEEVSAGKDTVTGHWEMMGITVNEPFPLFHHGFPDYVLEKFSTDTGFGTLFNARASGTEIIERLGEEHLRSRKLILYTSADSVFQIAAHEELVSIEKLYEICRVARKILDPLRVLRVIARPFAGKPGSFYRTSGRKDFALEPLDISAIDLLGEEGVEVVSVGKVSEMFSGKGFSRAIKSGNNRDGLKILKELLREDGTKFVFANLNDFDTLYGHRNDIEGFASELEYVDRTIPSLISLLRSEDMLIFTADHGNDPAFPGTDHTRERVPAFFIRKGREGFYLGVWRSFAVIGATILDYFGIKAPFSGHSFSEVM